MTLRTRLKKFRNDRKTKDDLELSIKTNQKELVTEMLEADPNGVGIVYDPSDEGKGAAYVQQNDATEFWNEEAIIEWLSKPVKGRRTIRLACTTRVFSIQKFEAEIAAGNIPARTARKLKKTGNKPTPFIRFGKITDENRGT